MHTSTDDKPVPDRTLWVETLRQNLLSGQQAKVASTPFLVRRPRQEHSPAAGTYVKCELGDQTGWVEAIWWEGGKLPRRQLETLLSTEVWLVSGLASLNHYGGKRTPQIKIDSARPMVDTDPVAVPGLVRRSTSTEEELQAWLCECIARVNNAPLRRLLEDTLGANGSWHVPFLRTPAALFYHHAYVGGLADHVREMASAWLSSAPTFPKADRDLTLAGILLHDVGKLDTYDSGSAPQLARAGRYVDHISAGIARLSLAMDRIPGFPPVLREHILHIVASHHGEKAYGSPVVPATREAIVVHHLDRLSSLLGHLEEWARQSEADRHGWTTESSPWLNSSLASCVEIPDSFDELEEDL